MVASPAYARISAHKETPRQSMVNAISQGLISASLKKCSRWAMRNRIMGNPIPGPVRFMYHPW